MTLDAARASSAVCIDSPEPGGPMRQSELKKIYPEHDVLYWLGPDLARAGLLTNEPWVEKSARKAIGMFGGNQGLQINAAILAVTHPYALDYLCQAPVLAIAAAGGACLRRIKTRPFVASEFCSLIKDGPRLKHLMQHYGVALPFRALLPFAIAESRWRAIAAMSAQNHSLIAQCIPEKPRAQRRWLANLSDWIEHMAARLGDDSQGLAWAMRAYAGPHPDMTVDPVSYSGRTIADLWIAMHNRGEAWNERWTLCNAHEAARQWHAELARQNESERCKSKYGLEYDEPVDYGAGPVLDDADEEGFTFHALRSCKELHEEGRAMHHCVASYFGDVASGRSRIYSVRHGDKRMATIEIYREPLTATVEICRAPLYDRSQHYPLAAEWGSRLRQASGPCNKELGLNTYNAICRFLSRHKIHR
jgi:hypothetical protein